MLSTFCPRRSTRGLSQCISGGRCSASESVEKRYCGVLERDVLEGRSVISKYCSGVLRKRSFAKKCCIKVLQRRVGKSSIGVLEK